MIKYSHPLELSDTPDWDAKKALRRWKPGNCFIKTMPCNRGRKQEIKAENKRKNKIKSVKTDLHSKRGTREVRILMQQNLPRSRITACQEQYLAGILNWRPGNLLNVWVMLQLTTRKTNNNVSELGFLKYKRQVAILSLLQLTNRLSFKPERNLANAVFKDTEINGS